MGTNRHKFEKRDMICVIYMIFVITDDDDDYDYDDDDDDVRTIFEII